MGIFGSLFRRTPKTNIPAEHQEPVDPFYAAVNVEEIGVYQRHFEEIIRNVDVNNYTIWSLSREHDRAKRNADDEWMYQYLQIVEKDRISGGLLQNMVNQFFFADMLMREFDKDHWVRRVMHPRVTEYFPWGAQMRMLMEAVSE